MKTEASPFGKMSYIALKLGEAKGKEFIGIRIPKKNVILPVLAFLLGRVSLLGGIMPFGTAVFAASVDLGISRLMVAASVIIGMVTGGARGQLYVSAASMLIIYALNCVFNKGNETYKTAFIAFVSNLIPQLVLVSLQGFLIYDLLMALMESFILFTIVFVFKNAALLIVKEQEIKYYTNEDRISISIVTALALAGLGGLQIFGITIKNVLSILTILIFSFQCGSGVGAATGVTVGVIFSISGAVTPLIVGTYAICGLLAGILRKLGRVGVSLGFIMGNALLTLYMNGSTEVLVHLKEIITAILFFTFIPKRALDAFESRINSASSARSDKSGYSLRIKEMTIERLNKFSRAFNELARTFSEISETKVVTDKQDISVLFDRVADNVCKGCSVCRHCWDRNFYNTYQVMFKIVERLDSKGRIEVSDIPEYFLSRCERINDFVKSVNSIYELFKVDMVWKSKIGESRNLVSQQLEGLSRVVSNLALEIDTNVRFKGELEDALLAELCRIGIKASEVIAIENNWGKYEVTVFHKGCGGKRDCISTIEGIVSKVLGRRMVKESNECYSRHATRSCSLRLIEEETYKVTTGIARVSKHNTNISGDSNSFMNTGDGKYIVALSDGMGSGQRASVQSKATITLLEQFMEAGFDKDTTVKLINSILVLKSDDDSFATIDLSVIDLYDGNVEFVKIGAAPTFIKKNTGVEVVRTVSLPAGILGNIEIELVNRKVESGEFVIMLSDGVLDAFRNTDEDSTKAVQRYIQSINTVNPQEIADTILDTAFKQSEGTPNDDMTVLVAKVWRRVA